MSLDRKILILKYLYRFPMPNVLRRKLIQHIVAAEIEIWMRRIREVES